MHIRLSTGSIALALCLILCAGPETLAAGKRPKNQRNQIEVANLNILHGFACDPPVPGDGDQCRVCDRLDLLVQHIAATGCPDLVTLQEIDSHLAVGNAECDPAAGQHCTSERGRPASRAWPAL